MEKSEEGVSLLLTRMIQASRADQSETRPKKLSFSVDSLLESKSVEAAKCLSNLIQDSRDLVVDKDDIEDDDEEIDVDDSDGESQKIAVPTPVLAAAASPNPLLANIAAMQAAMNAARVAGTTSDTSTTFPTVLPPPSLPPGFPFGVPGFRFPTLSTRPGGKF